MGMKLHCEKMTSLHEPCFQSGHCNSSPVASDKKAAHSTVDHGLHELFLVVENAYLQISVFPKARHDLCFYSIASGYSLSLQMKSVTYRTVGNQEHSDTTCHNFDLANQNQNHSSRSCFSDRIPSVISTPKTLDQAQTEFFV